MQLWVFWLAPIIGAAIAGATFHLITGVDRRDRDISGEIDPDDVATEGWTRTRPLTASAPPDRPATPARQDLDPAHRWWAGSSASGAGTARSAA